MIVIVDYLKGNLLSVARGLESAGARVLVSQDADVIARADALVLPGVGAFADAMETMAELGQDEAVREAVGKRAVPFLGICLGMHLMFEAGEEHAEGGEPTPGLSLIPGTVRRLPRTDAEGTPYKIPHVGWNAVTFTAGAKDAATGPREGAHQASSAAKRGPSERLSALPRPATEASPHCPLFKNILNGAYFYFTHSYAAPDSDATVGFTTHSVTFPSAVRAGNAFGVQFHPEKSSDVGQMLLANFVDYARKG